MAKEEEKAKEDSKPQASGEKKGGGLFYWLLLGAVIIAGSTGGFALSQLIGGQEPAAATSPQEEETKKEAENALLAAEEQQSSWPYEKLEPVLANLDEPGVTRYVRVTVTLEMSRDMDRIKGEEFLNSRQMVLRDWMTTYFAGLSLEDCRGTRNLSRIKKEVVENFNKILFPQSKPFVESVLFKEFAVQ
jgi:flagellar basal body-associated protein FliL